MLEEHLGLSQLVGFALIGCFAYRKFKQCMHAYGFASDTDVDVKHRLMDVGMEIP